MNQPIFHIYEYILKRKIFSISSILFFVQTVNKNIEQIIKKKYLQT